LWKTFELSSKRRYYAPLIDQKPENYGVFRAIHRQAARLHGRIAQAGFFPHATWRLISRCGNCLKDAPETKDPSGGTTGRVKPYGRLGWMGARAEYSLDGEG